MENLRTLNRGYRLEAELKTVPIAFVNALRRICLNEIPTVVVSNIEILDNTSSMTHEMIRHRVEMLPVNVRAEETAVIRDTKIELRFMMSPEARDVLSDDFAVNGPRGDILLKDRDLGTPLYFMTLKPNESLHIKASLAVVPAGVSQVCVSSFNNHIDPERARVDKDSFVAKAGESREAQNEAARVFDTFHIQRSYAINDQGRPYWFDFRLESIGVQPAKDILRKAVEVLQGRIAEWVKTPVQREEAGWYRMESEGEPYTIGQLVQEILYESGLVDYVARDAGHPLIPRLTIRFHAKTVQPEAVVERVRAEASALCENVLKSV
jgi:DNA-directed RNA polymerase subunit L